MFHGVDIFPPFASTWIDGLLFLLPRVIVMALRHAPFSPSRALPWLTWMFIFYTDITASLAVQPQNGQSMQPNLTTWNNLLNRPTGDYRCQRSKDWVAEDFDGEDCFRAIEHFHDVEVLAHKKHKFEFIAPTKPPAHPNINPQATPRNYTYGKEG